MNVGYGLLSKEALMDRSHLNLTFLSPFYCHFPRFVLSRFLDNWLIRLEPKAKEFPIMFD